MSELSPEARALLDRVKSADAFSEREDARIQTALASRLARGDRGSSSSLPVEESSFVRRRVERPSLFARLGRPEMFAAGLLCGVLVGVVASRRGDDHAPSPREPTHARAASVTDDASSHARPSAAPESTSARPAPPVASVPVTTAPTPVAQARVNAAPRAPMRPRPRLARAPVTAPEEVAEVTSDTPEMSAVTLAASPSIPTGKGRLLFSTYPASRCLVSSRWHSTPFRLDLPPGIHQIQCMNHALHVRGEFTVRIGAGDTTHATNQPLEAPVFDPFLDADIL